MVEKDTVQSMFLLELSKIDLPFVFKGGTSLSKAYNRIDRFSEDIDLSMNRKPTQTERKASKEHIVEIAKSLGMELTITLLFGYFTSCKLTLCLLRRRTF